MGMRDLPDMYACRWSPRAYISGKSQEHMLQVICITSDCGFAAKPKDYIYSVIVFLSWLKLQVFNYMIGYHENGESYNIQISSRM